MKKILAIVVAVSLLGAIAAAPAFAEPGWSVAGKILTGVIGLSILSHALSPPYYAYPAPVYAPPPRAYYPPEPYWIPGHYESRLERRWVPGHWEIERAGRHDYDDDDDYYDGGSRRYWVPGHYRNVEVRVWIPGHWDG